MVKVSSRNLFRKKPFLVVFAVLLLAIVALAALELTNTTHFFHTPKTVSGPIPVISHKTTPQSVNTSSANTKGANTSTDTTSSTGPAVNSAVLAAPSGIFVSNHHPGQNGTPLTEESTCTTTPGASCYIKLTQAGIVKTLPPQSTGDSGGASWDWSIGQAGLGSGSWQVEAVATLGSQTKTTVDPVSLEVQ